MKNQKGCEQEELRNDYLVLSFCFLFFLALLFKGIESPLVTSYAAGQSPRVEFQEVSIEASDILVLLRKGEFLIGGTLAGQNQSDAKIRIRKLGPVEEITVAELAQEKIRIAKSEDKKNWLSAFDGGWQ